MKKLITSSYSDKGDIRKENQDSILCLTGMVGKYRSGLFVVADGCGGMKNGEKISRLVTRELKLVWEKQLPDIVAGKRFNRFDIESMLDGAIDRINRKAVKLCKDTGEKGGSTVSLILMLGVRYFIRHAGDSRIYRVRYGIKQLTEDQTLVADMVRRCEITAEEARTHRKKNVLNMCIGYFDKVKLYKASGFIHRCDEFIICSDGLYNCISEKQLRSFVRHQRTADYGAGAERLRRRIPEGAARDNVSVILVRCKGWYL